MDQDKLDKLIAAAQRLSAARKELASIDQQVKENAEREIFLARCFKLAVDHVREAERALQRAV